MPDTNASNKPAADKASKAAIVTIVIVLVVMSLVAVHLNWIHWRRDKIEEVIVTPIATPTTSTEASPSAAEGTTARMTPAGHDDLPVKKGPPVNRDRQLQRPTQNGSGLPASDVSSVTERSTLRTPARRLTPSVIANSGERTRLACWRWRPAIANFDLNVFGEAPKTAREARALPE